jgi:hypothetical protein
MVRIYSVILSNNNIFIDSYLSFRHSSSRPSERRIGLMHVPPAAPMKTTGGNAGNTGNAAGTSEDVHA